MTHSDDLHKGERFQFVTIALIQRILFIFSPSCSFGSGANSSRFTARTAAFPFIFRRLDANSIPSRKSVPRALYSSIPHLVSVYVSAFNKPARAASAHAE